MSGLRKAKKYDWKDSNLANFGSDEERQVKKESAETEPAWEGAGQEEGVKVWRVEQFEVKDWPKEDYGKFYNGDSYIILNTYKVDGEDELKYDVHFWIGQESTQDEYGTAAYKTVELDTLLDDKAIQHRQVQGHETELFKSYFPVMTVMRGGCASGFRHVEPEEYPPRLLSFRRQGNNKVYVAETPRNRSKVTSGDVFILDLGQELIQWNGSECNKDEKFKAAQYCQEIESERGGCSTEVVEECECGDSHKFYEKLDEEVDDDDEPDGEGEDTKKLFRLSNDSGSLEFEAVTEGDVTKDNFDSNDTFIFDTKDEVFVWVGCNASASEKNNGMNYAHLYTIRNSCPYKAISIMNESQETDDFKTALCA